MNQRVARKIIVLRWFNRYKPSQISKAMKVTKDIGAQTCFYKGNWYHVINKDVLHKITNMH